MNRELAEVRRYWPRARVQWTDKTATCFVVSNSWAIVYVDDAVTVIVDTVLSGRVKSSGATIAEAMRAAGFRRRGVWSYADHMAKNFPVGQYADHRRQRSEYHRRLLTLGLRVPSSRRNFILTCKLLAALTTGTDAADIALRPCDGLQSTQRPRKGARWGRRKRQSDATPEASPKWYAVAATYPRYELRDGAEVLTVVSYSRADGMWTAPRTGGFHTKEGAMRWEEMRLRVPTCPVAEVQP